MKRYFDKEKDQVKSNESRMKPREKQTGCVEEQSHAMLLEDDCCGAHDDEYVHDERRYCRSAGNLLHEKIKVSL